jgi:hypothetical protein
MRCHAKNPLYEAMTCLLRPGHSGPHWNGSAKAGERGPGVSWESKVVQEPEAPPAPPAPPAPSASTEDMG